MNSQQIKILTTPCVGKCSTTFGDDVCRGCTRYAQEIIEWNTYDQSTKNQIWQRLDRQLDSVLLPKLPPINLSKMSDFILTKNIHLPQNASKGRSCYLVIKFCSRFPIFLEESGLNISIKDLKVILTTTEEQLYQLSMCEYKLLYALN